MHLASQNYVEAALSLKLHADLHDWDLNSYVEPLEDLGLPKQSRFARKETLCLLILDYLGIFPQVLFILCSPIPRQRTCVGKRY